MVSAPDASWTEPVFVSRDGGNGSNPVVAADGLGGFLVAWREGQTVVASRLSGGTFDAPTVLPFDAGLPIPQQSSLSIAANAAGFGAVAELDQTGHNIVVSRFAPDAGWSLQERISPFTQSVDRAVVTIDDTGAISVVWMQPVPGNLVNVFRSRSTVPSTWSAPTQVPPDAGALYDLAAAGSGSGQLLVAWYQSEGFANVAYAATSLSDGGFSTSRLGNGISPKAAVNSAGDGVVCYAASITGGFEVRARTVSSSGWAAEQVVAPDAGLSSYQCAAAVDPTGTAVVALTANDGHVYAANHTGAGWAATVLASNQGFESNNQCRVALGAGGAGVISWYAFNAWGNAFSSPLSFFGPRIAGLGFQAQSAAVPAVTSDGHRWLVYPAIAPGAASPSIFASHNP